MSVNIGDEIGKYQVLQRLGNGAFGTVFRVLDRAINSETAIKLVPAAVGADIGILLQEAQNLKKCECRHIVEVNGGDIAVHKGNTYVVVDMELLIQGSLADIISTNGANFSEILCASRHVLLGLAASHREGIIHRDVKPANILLTGVDYKLSDFGISHLKASATGQPMFYSPNAAPEVIQGNQADERSDIYSLGTTLFRTCILHGDFSIPIASFDNWLVSGMKSGLPEFLGFPRYVPLRLKRVIQKATHLDPKQRYQTAEDMLAALEKLKLALPWAKNGPHAWRASTGGKIHSLQISTSAHGWELSYSINGRRRKADCVSFKSEALAAAAMEKKVAATLLA